MKYRTSVCTTLTVLLFLSVGYAQQSQTNPSLDNQKTAAEDSTLKVVHRVPPVYPQEARANGVEGTVVVEALVDKQGNVARAKIISGPKILADAAVEALKAWKFEPATSQGQPVEKTTQIKISFAAGGAKQEYHLK